MSFDEENGESWSACNWYNGDPGVVEAACKQTPGDAKKVSEYYCITQANFRISIS